MKLLIDAGNTRIKWALVDSMTQCVQAPAAGTPSPCYPAELAGPVMTGNLAGDVDPPERKAGSSGRKVPETNSDEWLCSGVFPVGQAGDLAQQFSGMKDINQIWASNVAGETVARHIRDIRVHREAGQSTQYHFIAAREKQCGVRNGYTNAGQLGSDRWAALIAAWHLVRGKCLVVNCGTATTIDTLSAEGEFVGGLILPGVELMQRSLAASADQLNSSRGVYGRFPRNSADAIYSGAIQASCGAIERQYSLSGDDRAVLIMSGGAAGMLQPYLDQQRFGARLCVVDNLVLQGLLLLAKDANP